MTFAEMRQELANTIEHLDAYKEALRPGDYSNKVVCAKVDLGHVVRDLKRGLDFLDRHVKEIAEADENRWSQDMEAGAIG